jgi:hypothetical protein
VAEAKVDIRPAAEAAAIVFPVAAVEAAAFPVVEVVRSKARADGRPVDLASPAPTGAGLGCMDIRHAVTITAVMVTVTAAGS